MRAPLSIVIPTLNAASELPEVLASLMEGLSESLIRELVVSDGGSTDETIDIARASGAEVISGAAGRGGQMLRGAAATKGDWLLFLHADSQLTSGWSEKVWPFLADPTLAGYGQLAFRDDAFLARATAKGANLRSRIFALPYGDQSLLISRELYNQVGGYPDQPLMEDVEMAKRLKGHLKPVAYEIKTSAERYQKAGYTKRVLRNLSLILRYKLGADPKDLARDYES